MSCNHVFMWAECGWVLEVLIWWPPPYHCIWCPALSYAHYAQIAPPFPLSL